MTSEIRPGIRRLLRLVTRRSMLQGADEEIRLHLELRTKQLIGEGMSPSTARAEAATSPPPTRGMRHPS